MATAMIYDTLKLAEQLEHQAGFDAARARAMARIFAENANTNLATREDLLMLRDDLLGKVGSLEGKIGTLEGRTGSLEGRVGGLEGKIGSLEVKIGSLEVKIGSLESKVGVLYWMTTTTLAGMAALLGIAISIALHLMHLG